MRNKTRVALAAIAACALTIGTAVPAGAQEEPESLGFAVDKTEGPPGALVLGKANAADVAEHCVTDLEEFQNRFLEWAETKLADPDGPVTREFFPDGDITAPVENYGQMAFLATALVGIGIAFDIGGASADALPQTFVMTFADIATQEPMGARGNFDPNTGDGSVVVPDLDPGNWAVAAACVGPSFDEETIIAAMHQTAGLLEEIGVPVSHPFTGNPDPEAYDEFLAEFLDSDATGIALRQEFLALIGPDALEPLMVPDAFGAVLFCIHNDQGECPGPPPPPPELDEDDTKDMTPPAQAVVATPSFTG